MKPTAELTATITTEMTETPAAATTTKEALVDLLMRSDWLGEELHFAVKEITELARNPLLSKPNNDLPEETRKFIQKQVQVVLQRIAAIDEPRVYLQMVIALHLQETATPTA